MKNKFPVVFALTLAALLLDCAFTSVMLFNYNKACGIAGLIASALLITALILLVVRYGKNSLRRISRMNAHLETSAAQYMNSLPAPVAVINSKREFVWYNQIFSEKISLGSDLYGLDLEGFVRIDLDALEKNGRADCQINGSHYTVYSETFKENDLSFLILYFSDQTMYYKLKKQTDDNHPNVLILTIDNYDDIMQNAKESEKAQASVETEKLIEKFMNGTDGFIKKTSTNTFFAVIDNSHLDRIINDKFNILDAARNIRIASKYPLTFSIGVGRGAETLSESEEVARQCLDMALGRGGDQAVLKTDGGYRFFGGVSKGVEKKSRAKTRIIANALQDLIVNSSKVFIMGHRFGDLDSVGAACGIAGAVRILGREAHIAVNRQKNLASHLIDIVEERTDKELFITPEEAEAAIGPSDLLVIVDTHNKDYIESSLLYEKARQVVVIDHHRKTVNFIDNAVIFHHEPYASSACEMVTELIQYFRYSNDERIDSCYAEALLSGIMLDTKNFVMRTGIRTFEAAAYLKKLGADTVAVKLLFSSSFESYRRKTQVVASAELYNKCAIAMADFSCDDIRLVAPQAADELLNITDVDASFVIYQTGNTINISGRSLGAVNVQVIMEELGGGGHQTMAATQIEDISLQEAKERLMHAIDIRSTEMKNVQQ
jgi:c-di-AMP phosphodiesterase-like protein